MMITEAAGGWSVGGVRRQPDHVLDAQRPSLFLGRTGGPFLGAVEAPVVMVGSDSAEVERRLGAGELVCPCGGVLARWGHARPRTVRGVGLLRPRRARCVACRVTHVLLAVVVPAAPGRRRRGDRCRVAGEGGRGGASADRGAAGPAGVDGAGLAARVRPERRGGAVAVHRRCWSSWTRSPRPLPSRPGRCSPTRWR